MSSADKNHDEFMQLFLEFQPRIYSYIRSLLFQKADADDVMQETASILWQKFDSFEEGTHFDRWAMRVAFNQVRYFRQKKARESNRLQFSDKLLDMLGEESFALVDQTEDTAAALEKCLRKLDDKDRQLVAWRYEPDATNRSVSHKWGKSESVVSRSLARIYQSLMQCISLQLKFDGKVG